MSTSAFSTDHLPTVLAEAEAAGIRRLELSSGLRHQRDVGALLSRYRDTCTFLIHNYFPAPETPFTLNLASSDPLVVERSMRLCRDAIALCADLGAPFYSIHCGYAFDSDGSHLGRREKTKLPRIPMAEALDHFCRRLRRLVRVAEDHGVAVAIENNVVDSVSLVDNRNMICLGADREGLEAIFARVDSENLHLLLDLGHAKINETTVGQPVDELIAAFSDRVVAVHISDNDGAMDLNWPVSPDSTVMGYLEALGGTRVIECGPADIPTLHRQLRLLETQSQTQR